MYGDVSFHNCSFCNREAIHEDVCNDYGWTTYYCASKYVARDDGGTIMYYCQDSIYHPRQKEFEFYKNSGANKRPRLENRMLRNYEQLMKADDGN